MLHLPLPHKLLPTPESLSFRTMPYGWTGLPLAPHPGAFGVTRKFHVHEGVDLYCAEGTEVRAMEEGTIVWMGPFTGPEAGFPHWFDTEAVMIEGESGCVLYGEIGLLEPIECGSRIEVGQPLGHVRRVLRNVKGRPTSMLHLELYEKGTREPVEWPVGADRPFGLLDPTPLLMMAAEASWRRVAKGFFLKAEDRLIPADAVTSVALNEDATIVTLTLNTTETVVARDFDAIEAIMALKPAAIEGRYLPRLRWVKGQWAVHNLIAHPLMQILAWAGYPKVGLRIHDATVPKPTLRSGN